MVDTVISSDIHIECDRAIFAPGPFLAHSEYGQIWKSCCIGQYKDVMMIQYCDRREIALPPNICANSCVYRCESKEEIICGVSVVKDTYCAPQNCNGITDKTRV